ncbi:hypothetical protein [Geothrix sp. 21YS21S-2]|uniref:hypothetical protein n=1 Tax=Geothrix sp. 21YS21S-2 TaxID=3068893 RepID=UPI0027B883C0|nr:hypothetical protein [Geothrix sp. 21YS21S-2]
MSFLLGKLRISHRRFPVRRKPYYIFNRLRNVNEGKQKRVSEMLMPVMSVMVGGILAIAGSYMSNKNQLKNEITLKKADLAKSDYISIYKSINKIIGYRREISNEFNGKIDPNYRDPRFDASYSTNPSKVNQLSQEIGHELESIELTLYDLHLLSGDQNVIDGIDGIVKDVKSDFVYITTGPLAAIYSIDMKKYAENTSAIHLKFLEMIKKTKVYN